MRVLQVVDGTGWGGTKEQVYLTSRELKKKGIDVHIALNQCYTQMVEKLEPYGVKIHFFEDDKPNPRYRWSNYRRLIEIVNKNRFEIVVANSPKAMDYVALCSYFFKPKPKIVAFKRTGKGSSFLSKYFKYNRADRVIVVDRTTLESLRREGFFPEKLTYIPSGLDLNRFFPDRERGQRLRKEILKERYNYRVLINVANWIPQHKGQLFLIEAFSKLNCENCLLILVGIDTEKYAKEYAKKFGVEDRVLGLGFREDIQDLLNMADFFVFSSYFEGIAGAVLQAMACGKVVLSTFAGGIRDYLVDGVNGFGVEVGDMEGYVNKLNKILTLSEDDVNTISKNAISTAQKYSIEYTVDKHIELYQELTKTH